MVEQDKLAEKSHVSRRRNSTTKKNSKYSKNTTRRMTSAIWRVSADLNISLYHESAEKNADEDGNLTSIGISMFKLGFKLEMILNE